MRAGRLRHVVQLQRNSPVASNSLNEPTDNWITLATVRAAIEPLSGKEFIAAQQVQSDLTHRITIRYFAGLTSKDRLSWTENGVTRLFDIKAPPIDREERHREMALMCTEHG